MDIKSAIGLVNSVIGFTGYKDPDKKHFSAFIKDNGKYTIIVIIILVLSFALFAPDSAKEFVVQIIEATK